VHRSFIIDPVKKPPPNEVNLHRIRVWHLPWRGRLARRMALLPVFEFHRDNNLWQYRHISLYRNSVAERTFFGSQDAAELRLPKIGRQ
jgi:hypothetical protein